MYTRSGSPQCCSSRSRASPWLNCSTVRSGKNPTPPSWCAASPLKASDSLPCHRSPSGIASNAALTCSCARCAGKLGVRTTIVDSVTVSTCAPEWAAAPGIGVRNGRSRLELSISAYVSSPAAASRPIRASSAAAAAASAASGAASPAEQYARQPESVGAGSLYVYTAVAPPSNEHAHMCTVFCQKQSDEPYTKHTFPSAGGSPATGCALASQPGASVPHARAAGAAPRSALDFESPVGATKRYHAASSSVASPAIGCGASESHSVADPCGIDVRSAPRLAESRTASAVCGQSAWQMGRTAILVPWSVGGSHAPSGA